MGKQWVQRLHQRTSAKGKKFFAGRKKNTAAARAQARKKAETAKRKGVEEFRRSDIQVGYAGTTLRKRPSK